MSAPRAARVRGLYAVTPDTSDTESLVRAVVAAIRGGARLIQYRNKTAAPALRIAQARALKDVCGTTARLIINDHVDLALECDADGVHVGREDEALAEARRRLGPDVWVGVSCYDSLERARAARDGGADYVAFGSFFPSRVKPGAVRATVGLLREARRELTLPVVAIGGITIANAGPLVEAGADAVAVISALFETQNVEAAAAQFAALFDT